VDSNSPSECQAAGHLTFVYHAIYRHLTLLVQKKFVGTGFSCATMTSASAAGSVHEIRSAQRADGPATLLATGTANPASNLHIAGCIP
jgi:hypothetical protein